MNPTTAIITSSPTPPLIVHSELGVPMPFVPMIQPIMDVRTYLLTRVPVADCRDEEALLLRLPQTFSNPVREETRALCSACFACLSRVVNDGLSVQKSCKIVIQIYSAWRWELKTFRGKFDLWRKKKDWVVLVNRAKAGADWIEREFGLPDKFLTYAAARVGEFKRADAQAEALRSLRRQWQTGLNHRGQPEPIPGYAENWAMRNVHDVPQGWTIGNLRLQLKKRAKISRAAKAALHQGIAAARAFIPQVRSTREGLRFMEEVQFDDVKVDFRVFDTATGKPVDLWLLIAHDRATGMLLGFGMRPATVREDGSQEHLKLQDTKQLFGWTLERYGLPPYLMVIKLEHGTATLSAGSVAAIEEMLPGRLQISFSQMISGKSPSGYLERALGNSKGKASLESHNRIMHMIGSGLPGQTGPHYGARPMDLAAREKECVTIWNAALEFPEGLREKLVNEFGYPLLTLQQARKELVRIFNIRNSRTDHTMEGFEKILVNEGGRVQQRMESPMERMMKLRAGLEFSPVSPEIIAAFYEHTERLCVVKDSGEIEFTHEGRLLTFANPGNAHVAAGKKVLAYFHPDEPRFLYLTDANGAILGTWLRRALVRSGDKAALQQAIHFANATLKNHRDVAAQLNAGETNRLEEMRERNAQLLAANTFTDVAEVVTDRGEQLTSSVASALTHAPRRVKKENDNRDEDERIAREALKNLSV